MSSDPFDLDFESADCGLTSNHLSACKTASPGGTGRVLGLDSGTFRRSCLEAFCALRQPSAFIGSVAQFYQFRGI